MKNKFWSVLFIVQCASLQFRCMSQVLENKLNIYGGYSIGTFYGKKSIDNGNFSFPSFYNNLNTLNGFSVQGLYKIKKTISVGLNLQNMTGSNWNNNATDAYQGAIVKLTTFSPLIQWHTKFHETGTFNRLKIFFEVSSNIGISNLTLKQKLSDMEETGVKIFESQLSGRSNYLGITSGIGAEYNISRQVGFMAKYSLTHTWIQSSMYIDKGFTNSLLSFGIYRRLLTNKRYFY